MPLFALCKDGTSVAVAVPGSPRHELVQSGPFTCAGCGQALFVRGGKHGGRVGLHFSHYSGGCSGHGVGGGGGESALHLAAKEAIASNSERISITVLDCTKCDCRSVYETRGMMATVEGRVDGLPYRFDVLMQARALPREEWIAVEIVHTSPVSDEKIRAVQSLAAPGKRFPRILQVRATSVLEAVGMHPGPTGAMTLADTHCASLCAGCASTPNGVRAPACPGPPNAKRHRTCDPGWDGEQPDFLRQAEDGNAVAEEHAGLVESALAFDAERGIMRVRAIAGGGKSTFMERFARRCSERGDTCIVLMFNKEPAAEISLSLGGCAGVNVRTIDSLFWSKECDFNTPDWNFPGVKGHTPCVGARGCKSQCRRCPPLVVDAIRAFLMSNDDAIKAEHCGELTRKAWPKNHGRYIPTVARLAREAWGRICRSDGGGRTNTSIVKKMCQLGLAELPVLLSGARYVLVDECQDLTECELDLLLRRRDGVTCVAVGDPAQNINQFRGAASRGGFASIDVDRDVVLPCTWRFTYPLSAFVERLCSRHYPGMRVLSASGAAGGGCTRIVQVASMRACLAGSRDLHCICRTNAGLVSSVLGCDLGGRRVVAGGLERKWGAGLEELLDLHDFMSGAKQKAQLCDKLQRRIGPFSHTFDEYRRRCTDRPDELSACILVDTQRAGFREGLECLVRAMQMKEAGVEGTITLHTAHGSKGKTLDDVYVGDGFSVGGEEGVNCLYVALTRARRVCYIHESVYDLME